MLKTELHIHTGDDPTDYIPFSTFDLIERAAGLKYQALAITLHERQLDLARYEAYARARGIVLIPGVERTIEGKHVLLLNFSEGADRISTFSELAALRTRSRGLVIAPHPFFPASVCLGTQLTRHAGLFDAVELNYFYTKLVDFNRPAVRWARAHGKPVVANTDVHRLEQLGPTYTLVDADPTADSICRAIRAGRVALQTEPISSMTAARHVVRLAEAFLRGPAGQTVTRDAGPAPSAAGTPSSTTA
jgi:predicted metal-dependent phosphoesterase TrpH